MTRRPSQRPSSVIACCLVAFVLSAHFVACIDGDVRLVGSPRSIEGRVEVESGGAWGGICSDGWDFNDANVVCHQLGYIEGAMLAGTSSGLGFLGTSLLFLTELECIGGEDRLSDCPGYQIQVDNSRGACEGAALVCQLPGYLGCFSGVLTWSELSNILQDVTIDRCIAACNARGSYRFARLSGGQICQCGSSPSFGTQVPADRCSVSCAGSSKQACGGLFDNRIFSYFPTSLGSTTSTYTSDNGIIVSPNFPGFYKPGINGVWTITYGFSRRVRFRFDYIDLFMDDSLEIRSGDTTIRIGHDENVLEYTLMGVQFEVTLHVDVNSREANAGFLLRYTDLDAATPAPPNPPTQAEETTQAPPTVPPLTAGTMTAPIHTTSSTSAPTTVTTTTPSMTSTTARNNLLTESTIASTRSTDIRLIQTAATMGTNQGIQGLLFWVIGGIVFALWLTMTTVIVVCCLKKRRSAKSSSERDTGSRHIGLTRLTPSAPPQP